MTNTGAGDDDTTKRLDGRNKGVIFKNCAPFTIFISRINNTDIDTTQDIDIAMLMYNLIEYSDNYSETPGSLLQYCKDIPAVNVVNFDGANATDSFNFKTKITGQTDNNGRIDNVEIMVPLKYLSNFWRTLEMPLINCEVNLILTWSPTCVISSATGETKLKITETKLFVPVVTLSTQDNTNCFSN